MIGFQRQIKVGPMTSIWPRRLFAGAQTSGQVQGVLWAVKGGPSPFREPQSVLSRCPGLESAFGLRWPVQGTARVTAAGCTWESRPASGSSNKERLLASRAENHTIFPQETYHFHQGRFFCYYISSLLLLLFPPLLKATFN